ncbi:HAD-IIIA family hydrolase [Pseudoflavonifractor sp. 524-17]|uniref:HAD-IIIA family hydrolase n=1 Tax=Pseudoflavonifractor sp. 524-17 TaxID=2304577 RepID=UPI001FADC32A|nr:HAD-IIIA family hydrolase [Pseudoflavonifractor sp. 524-17]
MVMKSKIEQAVILAGGYGTRLKPFTDTNPKPMYPFEGKPFLEYLIEQVRSFGIQEIVLLLGYLPEKIQDYFGDGSRWGVHITYSVTPVEYETGLRIKSAAPLLSDEFLLMYCDNYCPIDFVRLVADYEKSGALLQFTAYRNKDGSTKNNLRISEDELVEVYDKKRITPGLQGVDIGYAIVNKRVLALLPEENHNFEAVVYPTLVAEKKLYATVTEHRYYSVGSWERIELTKEFFRPKKVVFLDRDGTLNVRPPRACYIERPEDFVWLPGAREAVKKLKDAGYTLILISNQPGIARGNLTEETLAAIHEKMQADLREIGAEIDKIYYCPHNWDDGCECRKPRPGMFFQAQKELSLDLTKCVMIGDDERDMEAATAAGVSGLFINEKSPLETLVSLILGG